MKNGVPFKKFDLIYKWSWKMLSRSSSRSLFFFSLKIIQLFSLVFFWENASFSSYQRGKVKMAYPVYTRCLEVDRKIYAGRARQAE